MGVSLLDTSDQYGPFTNEVLLGEALSGLALAVRARAVVATKGGLVVEESGRTVRDASPAHLKAALPASLGRLGVERVGLYQLHRVDPATPLERSWETLAEFVAHGRVGAIGLSEVSVAELERARAIHPVASVQSELSLWSREALEEVVPYCRENHIAFIAYAPLGRGFLSGTIDRVDALPAGDWRRGNPRFQPEALAGNRSAIFDPVAACAADLGVLPAQVALAWVLAQGPHILSIPGTKRMSYLEQNWTAGSMTLPDEWLHQLDDLPATLGTRY